MVLVPPKRKDINIFYGVHIPYCPKLRQYASILSVINSTLSIILVKKKGTTFLDSAGFFRQNSNSLEILQQAAELKMELLWKK